MASNSVVHNSFGKRLGLPETARRAIAALCKRCENDVELQIAHKTALRQGSSAIFFRMQDRQCLCGLRLHFARFAAKVVDGGLR